MLGLGFAVENSFEIPLSVALKTLPCCSECWRRTISVFNLLLLTGPELADIFWGGKMIVNCRSIFWEGEMFFNLLLYQTIKHVFQKSGVDIIARFPPLGVGHVNWSITHPRTRSAATTYNAGFGHLSIIDSFCCSILSCQTPEYSNTPSMAAAPKSQGPGSNRKSCFYICGIFSHNRRARAQTRNDIFLIELIPPVKPVIIGFMIKRITKYFSLIKLACEIFRCNR